MSAEAPTSEEAPQPAPEKPKAPRRMGLWVPWALFAALVVLWSIYWFALAIGARNELNRQAERFNKTGAQFFAQSIEIKGYPLHLAIEINGAQIVTADRLFRASTPQLVIHINLSNPNQAAVTFPAPVDFVRSDAPHRLTGQNLRAGFRLRGKTVTQAGIEGDDVRLDDLDPDGFDFTAKHFVLNARPDPRGHGAWQVALSADNLGLGKPVRGLIPLGQEIARLNAALVLEKLQALRGGRGENPLARWREAGGGLRVEALDLEWGAAKTNATGHISLDDTRRITGELTLNIASPARVLTLLATGPDLRDSARNVLALTAALNTGAAQLSLPLQAYDGWLFLNRAKLRRLAPVYGANDCDAPHGDKPLPDYCEE